ncbi:hypothetical protein DFH08DRAFT_512371 [Mycena albidolilacea]|uniref:Uncharacterized protein n=1 Tax=Mycena albidolilacea TaxID=1033008 RepID=A0AAD6Z570_9AGAR|nr:hypothetical protein DFH08DRAFT_512371 [Mycena albidolilacea]
MSPIRGGKSWIFSYTVTVLWCAAHEGTRRALNVGWAPSFSALCGTRHGRRSGRIPCRATRFRLLWVCRGRLFNFLLYPSSSEELLRWLVKWARNGVGSVIVLWFCYICQ